MFCKISISLTKEKWHWNQKGIWDLIVNCELYSHKRQKFVILNLIFTMPSSDTFFNELTASVQFKYIFLFFLYKEVSTGYSHGELPHDLLLALSESTSRSHSHYVLLFLSRWGKASFFLASTSKALLTSSHTCFIQRSLNKNFYPAGTMDCSYWLFVFYSLLEETNYDAYILSKKKWSFLQIWPLPEHLEQMYHGSFLPHRRRTSLLKFFEVLWMIVFWAFLQRFTSATHYNASVSHFYLFFIVQNSSLHSFSTVSTGSFRC